MAVGTTTSTQTTQIDPAIQPYLTYGLTEAQRLYQAGGPQYYQGQGYVGPSDATETGLQALQARAAAGNPLLGQAQGVFSNAASAAYNPAMAQYQNLYQNAGRDPSAQFYGQAASGAFSNPALAAYGNLQTGADAGQGIYNQYAFGNNVNPAMAGTAATAGGAFLGGNQFFQGAFQPAAEAATTAFNQSINDVTSNASKAGRYGSGAMTNLQNSAANTLAKNLTGTAGQLAYQNYSNERAAQEAAQSRLGALSQQDVANRMSAAQNLTSGSQAGFQQQLAKLQGLGSLAQQGFANQMAGAQQLTSGAQNQYSQQLAATSGLGGTYQNAVQQQLAAAGQLPSLAEADYGDINKMMAAGQLREGYQQQALQADMAKYNYQQQLPQTQLTNYLSNIGLVPKAQTTTSQQPYFTNPTATALGTGLLGVQLLGGLDKIGSTGTGANQVGGLTNAYNWLTNWGSTPTV